MRTDPLKQVTLRLRQHVQGVVESMKSGRRWRAGWVGRVLIANQLLRSASALQQSIVIKTCPETLAPVRLLTK